MLFHKLANLALFERLCTMSYSKCLSPPFLRSLEEQLRLLFQFKSKCMFESRIFSEEILFKSYLLMLFFIAREIYKDLRTRRENFQTVSWKNIFMNP